MAILKTKTDQLHLTSHDVLPMQLNRIIQNVEQQLVSVGKKASITRLPDSMTCKYQDKTKGTYKIREKKSLCISSLLLVHAIIIDQVKP